MVYKQILRYIKCKKPAFIFLFVYYNLLVYTVHVPANSEFQWINVEYTSLYYYRRVYASRIVHAAAIVYFALIDVFTSLSANK